LWAVFCDFLSVWSCAEEGIPEKDEREEDEYAHVSYYFFSGLFGLVVGARDLVLLETGIALADDSLDLGELARLLLYSHGVIMCVCLCCVM
jgi:hypothetical protein